MELNEGEEAGLEVVEAALRRSPPPQVPVSLSLATRHRLRPREGAFATTTAEFAQWWLSTTRRPSPTGRTGQWQPRCCSGFAAPSQPASPPATRAPRARCATTGGGSCGATTLDPADPLDAAVSGCAFHNAGEHERLALARYIAQLAAQQGHVDAGHVAWQAALRYRGPQPAPPDMLTVLAALRAENLPVTAALAAEAFVVLAERQRSPAWLDVLDTLEREGHRSPATLEMWHEQDR